MTGRGPTGLAIRETPLSDTRCEQSPGKRQFPNMGLAQAQADFDNHKYKTHHVAYACPSCGLFHVTSKATYGDVVRVNPDGRVVTAAMTTRAAKRVNSIAQSSPGRVDMTEIQALDRPIVPVNRAAREKLLAEFLKGKTSVKMADVAELLQTSNQNAGEIMRKSGWRSIISAGAGARWIPQGANPLDSDEIFQRVKTFLSTRSSSTVQYVADQCKTDKRNARRCMVEAGWGQDGRLVTWRPLGDKITVHVPEDGPTRKGSPGRVPKTVAARRKKLKAYLAKHPSPTTDELTAVSKTDRHALRGDMAALGWWIRKGRNATWQQGERPLHLVENPPAQAEPREEPPVTPPMAAPQEPEQKVQVPAEIPAAAPEPVAAPVVAEPAAAAAAPPAPAPVVTEDDWRQMPDTPTLGVKTISRLIEEAALFGLEIRVQMRQKRPDAG